MLITWPVNPSAADSSDCIASKSNLARRVYVRLVSEEESSPSTALALRRLRRCGALSPLRLKTAEIVRAFAKDHPEVRLLQNPGNHGKGYSVRNGILHSLGEVAMFTDADLSAPIEEAEGLFAAIAAGADIAIGSRWLERTRQTIRQPLYRQFFGRCFNGVTRAVMGLRFVDTQCGFKAFTRAAAQTVFQLQTIERWGFDPEILFIALKRGYRVQEVPVSWAHDERTRISVNQPGGEERAVC